MGRKKQSQTLGRRMQLLTLIPLMVGIILCALITIALLFVHYTNWASDIEKYLVESEVSHLKRVAESRAQTLTYSFNDITSSLSFLNEIQKDTSLSSVRDSAEAVDAYTTFDTLTYPDESVSVYISEFSVNLEDSTVEILDYVLRPTYRKLDGVVKQIGFVKQVGPLDFRYPLQDMTYIQSMTECDGESIDVFNIICTETYKLLYDSDYGFEVVVFYEYDQLNVFYKNTNFDFIAFTNQSNLLEVMQPREDYIFFMTQNNGVFVVVVDDTPLAELAGLPLHTSLFPDGAEEQGIVVDHVIPLIQDVAAGEELDTDDYTFQGETVDYAGGVSTMNITFTGGSEQGYSLGVLVNQESTLKGWNDLVDSVIFNLIGQIAIFVFFLLISLICAWLLSRTINKLVITPLKDIEMYLKERNTIKQVKKDHNKEANQIIEQLGILDNAQKFIIPNFLMNPNSNTRIKNLKKAIKVFRGIQNKRCEANAQTLVGNTYYSERKYKEAITAYMQAYELVKSLLEEVRMQDEQEREKSIATDFRKIEITVSDELNWDIEKDFLHRNIIKRLQQLCMAKVKYLSSDNLTALKVKELCLEVVNYQVEALDYALAAKIDIVEILKLLLDIADLQIKMLYQDSASELLNLVLDELFKIESESRSFVDIDIGRLKRIGLPVNDLHVSNQFTIESTQYELCVLKQMTYFRKGVISKDRSDYKTACEFFAKAIYEVDYYNPEVREACVKEMHKLLSKYNLIGQVPFVGELHNDIKAERDSVVFLFAYDVYQPQYSQLSMEIIDIMNEEVALCKVGATTAYTDTSCDMLPHIHDFLQTDFNVFLEQARTGNFRSHLYDAVAKARGFLEEGEGRHSLVILVDDMPHSKSSTYLADLKEIMQGLTYVVVFELQMLGNIDFREFISEDIKGVYIDSVNGCDLPGFRRALRAI